MRILLDTQIFLWYVTGDRQIPAPVMQAVRDPNNEVFLSVVAIWEAVIKYQLGKLPLPQPPEAYLPEQRRLHRIASLDVDEASVVQLGRLPQLHRDPFDRLMICQAIEHGHVFATVDKVIHSYTVRTLPQRPNRLARNCNDQENLLRHHRRPQRKDAQTLPPRCRRDQRAGGGVRA